MSQEMTVQEKLKIQARRLKYLNWIFTILFSGLMLTFFVFAYLGFDKNPQNGWLTKIISAFIVSVVIGFPTLKLLIPVFEWAKKRYTASWTIEVLDDVVKVRGRIPVKDWHEIQQYMLSIRPGYMPVEDSVTRFGCAMAAVPANPGYLNAKQELSEMGITI